MQDMKCETDFCHGTKLWYVNQMLAPEASFGTFQCQHCIVRAFVEWQNLHLWPVP